MVKNNLKLKEKLTFQEVADFTKELVNACFDEDESGNVVYMPYNTEPTFKILFYLFCVDGLTFEDNDMILELAESDEDLVDIWDSYKTLSIEDDDSLSSQLWSIREYAQEMTEFKIQQIVHKSPWDLLVRALVDKINSADFNVNTLADAIMSAYLKSDAFKENREAVKLSRMTDVQRNEKYREELEQFMKERLKNEN